MPLILGTNSIKDTGYDVANSCRFFNNTQLKRTNGSPTNAYKGTFSAWVKRSALSSTRLFQNMVDGNNYAWLAFNSSHQLEVVCVVSGSTYCDYKTNRLFRDVSAWLHIVVEMDTTEGTATNRMKFYVNGVQETSFATQTFNGGQNSNHPLLIASTTNYHTIGASEANTLNLDGYMTEVVLLDGQALDPTSFGEFDSNSPNIWKPIDVSGLTFGNNGYYLDFEDSGNLGDDESGNGNDFTEVNLSATDQSTDTCTNNFATLNPLAVMHSSGSNTFSEGNLKITNSADAFRTSISTLAVSKGKWYFESKWSGGEMKQYIGITKTQEVMEYLGQTANSYSFQGEQGRKYNNNSQSSFGSTASSGDIIMVAFDADNGAIWTGKNGTWFNSATQSEIEAGTTTNAMFSSITIDDFFAVGVTVEDSNLEINFGSPPFSISSGNSDGNGYGNFEYSVPSGYYSINTKNLAEFG